MMKPDHIPQDVWRVAQNICDQACMPEHYYTNGVVSAVQADIARAILAAKAEERERAALIAEEFGQYQVSYEIAAAIRNRGAA